MRTFTIMLTMAMVLTFATANNSFARNNGWDNAGKVFDMLDQGSNTLRDWNRDMQRSYDKQQRAYERAEREYNRKMERLMKEREKGKQNALKALERYQKDVASGKRIRCTLTESILIQDVQKYLGTY